MNNFQANDYTALRFGGSPASAALYRVICENPGLCLAALSRVMGKHVENTRTQVCGLEKRGLIRTELRGKNGRSLRLCWAIQ